MRVVVDANIVFSAILNTDGKIGDLLLNSGRHLVFIAPYFLKAEIGKHIDRLSTLSGLTTEQVLESEYKVCKNITFISEEQIKPSSWLEAEALVSDIDPKDTTYLAYTRHFRCKLWSGDKQLLRGLKRKGFLNCIDTSQLFDIREQKMRK